MISCLSPEPKGEKASFFTYTDFYGRTVSVDSVPQRIISLSPAITEMVFLLDEADKLVGISDFCNYPEATDTMNRVGGLQNINVESLVALNPDVVLIGSIVSKQDVEKMEMAGLKVVVIREENKIDGLCNSITILGKLLNKSDLAKQKVKDIQSRLNHVRRGMEGVQTNKKVYYVVGFGDAGDYTAPPTSHIHEIITTAGGSNIGAKLTSWNVSREYIFESDPDIIIIRNEDMDAFVHTKPYSLLRAVRENKVYPIESGWIDIVSPRNVLAVEYINKLLK